VEDPEDVAFLQVFLGQSGPAEQILAASDHAAGHDTIKMFITRPILRAVVALKAQRPAEAIQALEVARPYQLRDYSVLYWRAQAETEAGMLDAAAKDYHMILDNPGVNPIAPEYSLSHLRLAHVLSVQNHRAAALSEFQAFFNVWKEADLDLPLLARARQEYDKLVEAIQPK
jgi:hypothetical protein